MRFRLFTFALLSSLLSLECGLTAARAELAGIGPGAIAAIVKDAQGKPLAGVHVSASGPALREAETGASGYVALQALPLGTYRLRAERGGYDPLERTVSVSAAVTKGVKVIALQLAPLNFATLRTPPGSTIVTQPIANDDPNVAHQLGFVPGVTLVPSVVPQAGGVSLDGTPPQDARFMLDGIPLAGGGSQAALRARNALVLDSIAVAPGVYGAGGLALRNAIGGTVNYQTAPLGANQDLTLGVGYDDGFGSYQSLSYARTAGGLGFAFGAVTGSGDNRAQTLKAAYNLSSATTIDLAAYGSQTSAVPRAGLPATSAPAYAFVVSTSVETGTLRVRTYGSSLGGDRISGNQIAYDVPVGGELFSLGYDRSSEQFEAGASTQSQTTSSLLLRGEAPLGKAVRFSVADVLSSGTGVPARGDPQFGLVYRAANGLTLQASAGSSYATEPLVASNPAVPRVSTLPATAFAYQLSAAARLTPLDAVTLDAFRIDQTNRFASLSDARSTGATLSFAHVVAAGISVGAYANLLRSYAHGSVQPAWRYAATGDVVAAGAQFAAMPYASGRVQVAYRRADGTLLSVGTTYYGANNGLGPSATALTDVALGVPVGKLFNAQLGVRNLFGTIPPPSATYLYGGKGELTLSVGQNLGHL